MEHIDFTDWARSLTAGLSDNVDLSFLPKKEAVGGWSSLNLERSYDVGAPISHGQLSL